jgi:hypothetical protein
MKNTFSKSVLLLLLVLATVEASFGAGKELIIGIGPMTNNGGNGNWSGYSALDLIPGTAIMPIASTTTALYITFTSGSEADISNMVLYKTTTRGSLTIASVTPVKLGGISNPSIVLTNKRTCKVQPVSITHPCTVRLDVLTLTLSPLSDYWFVAYFSANNNNVSVYAGTPAFSGGTSLTGFYVSADETQFTAGQSIPNGNSGRPYFLTAVATN